MIGPPGAHFSCREHDNSSKAPDSVRVRGESSSRWSVPSSYAPCRCHGRRAADDETWLVASGVWNIPLEMSAADKVINDRFTLRLPVLEQE